MLAGTVIAVFGFPLVAPALVVLDLIRLRRHLPRLRVYLFLLQYMVNDTVEIVLAPLLWAMGGFGTRLDGEASITRHERIQWWSLDLLERRADRLLGLRLDIEGGAPSLAPGPVIVISRHTSLFDASLPGVVCERAGFRTRGVIMAELLADPGFDLIYGRLGSIFIPRDDGPKARAAIERMTTTSRARADETAYIIFPEGRLFRPDVRDRALSRLAEADPERAERLAGLERLLPPRPGGLRALLDALPEADVVMVDHRGLDRFAKMADLPDRIPSPHPVRVVLDRFDRSTIPDDPDAFVRWLDERWLALDRSLRADDQP